MIRGGRIFDWEDAVQSVLQAEPVANPVQIYVQKLPAVRRRPRVGTHGDKRSGRHRHVDRRHDLGTAICRAAADLTDQGSPRKQGATTAAQRAGLDFIPLFEERFDFVVPQSEFLNPTVQPLFDALNNKKIQNQFAVLGGYRTSQTGCEIQY